MLYDDAQIKPRHPAITLFRQLSNGYLNAAEKAILFHQHFKRTRPIQSQHDSRHGRAA